MNWLLALILCLCKETEVATGAAAKESGEGGNAGEDLVRLFGWEKQVVKL